MILVSFVALYVSVTLGSISFQRSGWLDRVVQYHKNSFLADLQKLPPVQIKGPADVVVPIPWLVEGTWWRFLVAVLVCLCTLLREGGRCSSKKLASIERAPFGYVDPDTWDYDSVMQLLGLLQQSESAAPVLNHLRRAIFSRRFMNFGDTFKAFPSLAKDHPNYFYYNLDSEEQYMATPLDEIGDVSDDAIIVISNPTEARLPAAQISVKLLREIMEARAMAARYLPTTRWTIPWKPMNKTASTSQEKVTTEGSGRDTGSGSVTSSTDGGSTPAAAGETTSPPA